jgi:predicted transcriptional regulator
VHRNLVEFAELGVVEFVGEGRAKRPVARYDGLRIDVPFADHPTEGTTTAQAD